MVLCVSPHLDDAVFSAGALLSALVAGGTDVTVATAFTATVAAPRGFALSCQTDKGYGPEVDYMALRRGEDEAACGLIGAAAEHWGFAEAPHRGYDTPVELFAGVRDAAPERALVEAVAARLEARVRALAPRWVLYPIGAGGHVDHLVAIAAVDLVRVRHPGVAWLRWFDQPYVARALARGAPTVVGGAGADLRAIVRAASAKTASALAGIGDEPVAFDGRAMGRAGARALAAKWAACAAYASQVGYQFYEALGESRVGADPAEVEARIAGVIGAREWVWRAPERS